MAERFILQKRLGNTWVLNDTGDDSMVCIITGGKRGEKKTLAMAGGMVDALNRAVSRGGERHDGCGSASAAD